MTVLHRGRATPFYIVVCDSALVRVVKLVPNMLFIASCLLKNWTYYCIMCVFFNVLKV